MKSSSGKDCTVLPTAQHFFYNASSGAIHLTNGPSKGRIVAVFCCSPLCDAQRCGAQPHPEPVDLEHFSSVYSVQFMKWKNVIFDLSYLSNSTVQVKLRKSGKCLVAPATPNSSGVVLDTCERSGSQWKLELVGGGSTGTHTGSFVLGTAVAGGCAAAPPPPSRMHCLLDAQATQIVAKLNAYFQWAKNDTRIIGFNPW